MLEGRLLERRRLRPARALVLPADLLNHGPFPDGRRPGLDPGRVGVGGGTVVNWTNCLRTHDWVREEWARDHGLEGLDGAEYDAHLDAVLERLQANDECSRPERPAPAAQGGLREAGYDFRLTVRNADRELYDPESAGYMGFGDQSGAKLSTAKTYLADAQERRGRDRGRLQWTSILVEDGRAAGVEATWRDPAIAGRNGAGAKVVVRAPDRRRRAARSSRRRCSCGPGSGAPPSGGTSACIPPAQSPACYPTRQDWWWGPPQAALSHSSPTSGTDTVSWSSRPSRRRGSSRPRPPGPPAASTRTRILDWERGAPFINLTRDHGHGQVTVDPAGNAVVQYLLTDDLDVPQLPSGIAELVRMHEAAGAEQILSMARTRRRVEARRRPRGVHRQPHLALARAARVRRLLRPPDGLAAGWAPTRPPPWPTRSGSSTTRPGVWIGDASAFPSASGTNPMITIMALARRTAAAIAAA